MDYLGEVMYQQQPTQPPAVVARPKQMVKKTVKKAKQQPKQVVVWQPPNKLGPFTFVERGLEIVEGLQNSPWPNDPRAVTYYSAMRRNKLKVAVRVLDEGFFNLDIPRDRQYRNCFNKEWSYLKSLQCKYLADVYDQFELRTDIANAPREMGRCPGMVRRQ